MGKGTASMGKKSGKKLHISCRRCGSPTYHMKAKVCSSCGFGKSSRFRTYNWKKEGK
ncbi:MAG: 50S ribosomal protein L37e [Nanoarchaeota archaeon]